MQKIKRSTSAGTGRGHLLSIFFAFLAVLSTGGSTTLLVKFLPPIIMTSSPPPLPGPQPSQPPLPSLSLPSPPSSLSPPVQPFIIAMVDVSGGSYPYEVSWSLACDILVITGGTPYDAMHAVPWGTCALDMTLENPLALTLLAAVCSFSAPRLVPLALLLLASRCEAAGTCVDSPGCFHLNDGDCDDGGPGSDYDICDYGTDCSDCGPRPPLGAPPARPPGVSAPPQPPPPPPPPGTTTACGWDDNSMCLGTVCDNSMYGTSLCDGTYTGTNVDLYFKGLSGTIPPQLGDISQLEKLWLQGNSISGTIPAETSKLSQLEYLILYGNSISGTIPPDTGKLSQLEELDLESNSISGTIPPQLGDLDSLYYLDLRVNKLEYPRSSDARVEYDLATRICRGAGSAECLGIPPDSCSAFADAQQSITDPNECVVCDNQTASLIAGVCILLGIIALAAFVRFVVRNPWALKRWVSSAAILFNHAQTASIIASMRLEWPRSLIAIASALKLDLLMLPSVSCLFGGEDDLAFEAYTVYASSAMLVLLLAPLLVKYFALCRRRLAIADTAELLLSLIYSLLFTFAWSIVLELVAYVGVNAVTIVSRASVPAAVLGALLLVLLIRFSGNVRAFKRGVKSGVWRRPNSCGGSACCGTRPIPPRRLERQVAYLVGRFARHAPSWQVVIWLRQFLLLLLAFASNVLFDATTANTFNAGRYAIAALAIAVTLVFWRLHRRALPFAFRFQNALESCLYGATALFLALAMVYTALPADPTAARVSVEVLMAIVLLGSLIVGAVYSIRELRQMRRALADVDIMRRALADVDILSAADSKIDGSLKDRLRDSSVRLLRSSWLASPASDAFLGRDASGAVIMKRQQDMPAEAFVPSDEAVAMLERGDRSILALSYGWLTALHPDPHGTTLAAVRRFLSYDTASAAASDTGLFWDFCSLPQKGPNGEEKTEEEKAMFGRGLKVMGNFYASVTGTSVIQQRNIDLPPGATTGFGPGEYNPTPYEGDGGRGWCIFEQGTAMTVLAHLTAAERQAREEGKALPERFRRAQASRAKVYDIGGEAPVARECSLPPKQVLDEACRAIEKARFTGKADKVMVPQMLAEFEWTFRSTLEQALEDHANSGAAVERMTQLAVLRAAGAVSRVRQALTQQVAGRRSASKREISEGASGQEMSDRSHPLSERETSEREMSDGEMEV